MSLWQGEEKEGKEFGGQGLCVRRYRSLSMFMFDLRANEVEAREGKFLEEFSRGCDRGWDKEHKWEE